MNTNTNHPSLLDGPQLNAPAAATGPRGFARRVTEWVIAGAIMVFNIIAIAALVAVLVVSLSAIYWFAQRVLEALGGS